MIWTVNRLELSKIGVVGNCTDGEYITRGRKEQHAFQPEMSKTGVQLFELLLSMGTTKNDIERDNAGARIVEGWEQLVKTTARKVNRDDPRS